VHGMKRAAGWGHTKLGTREAIRAEISMGNWCMPKSMFDFEDAMEYGRWSYAVRTSEPIPRPVKKRIRWRATL
jgi:hypothetical protein